MDISGEEVLQRVVMKPQNVSSADDLCFEAEVVSA